MAKKNGKRYTEQERATILADMTRNGLTQVAAAKKHGVSAVTIWQWKRVAKRRSRRGNAHATAVNVHDLEGMLRAHVRHQVRVILPRVIDEEVARYMQQAVGKRR